ncbi:transcriptional regulator [Salmonella enterica]|nr:transcriptional regulator [Salmonella enterica]ELS1746344.1 transcriptional regulator [Salmonella enterica]ELW3720506.1 transcriptional regulator [Salmonella enterica]EMB7326534.1 transcriptional regulator [Salmonella enterica]
MENKINDEPEIRNDFSEKVELEAAKPVGGIRTTKKVTLEIDIEKTLKYLMLAGMAVLVVIYGYKGVYFVYDSVKTMTKPAYQIAVLDMQTLRKEFNKQNPESDLVQSKNKFENYFKALMKVYSERGYLVIDASLAVTIPDNVQIVSYIDLGESFGEVQSLQNDTKESGIR